MTTWHAVLLAVGFLAVIFVIFRSLHAALLYAKYRGRRLVSCPEDRCAAEVRVAAGKAAVQSLGGKPQIALCACSHWPEKNGCAQACLPQIGNDPQGTLVRNIVQRWYRGRSCAYCHKPIEKLAWHDHRPALLGLDYSTKQWNEVSADQLPEFFATHLPVCWSCHIAETFRREHPEKIVDRPPDSSRMSLYH